MIEDGKKLSPVGFEEHPCFYNKQKCRQIRAKIAASIAASIKSKINGSALGDVVKARNFETVKNSVEQYHQQDDEV